MRVVKSPWLLNTEYRCYWTTIKSKCQGFSIKIQKFNKWVCWSCWLCGSYIVHHCNGRATLCTIELQCAHWCTQGTFFFEKLKVCVCSRFKGSGTLRRPYRPWVATRRPREQSTKSFLLVKGTYIAMVSDADNILGHKNQGHVSTGSGMRASAVKWIDRRYQMHLVPAKQSLMRVYLMSHFFVNFAPRPFGFQVFRCFHCFTHYVHTKSSPLTYEDHKARVI